MQYEEKGNQSGGQDKRKRSDRRGNEKGDKVRREKGKQIMGRERED